MRSVTGLLFIVAVIWSIWYNPVTLWALSSVITAISLFEFYRIVFRGSLSPIKYALHITAGVLICTSIWIYCTGLLDINRGVNISVMAYVLYIVITIITELYNGDKKSPFYECSKFLFGHIYIAIPVGLLSFMAFYQPTSSIVYMPIVLIAFFAIIWVYDTGAFLSGITFGKHKLFERISPKKSWEGLIGGVIFSLIATYFISYFLDIYGVNPLSIYQWFGLTIVVTISATYGDLTESMLKRAYNIKDSGTILPGHGGMMDRFDSVFLASPMAFMYLSFIWYFQ